MKVPAARALQSLRGEQVLLVGQGNPLVERPAPLSLVPPCHALCLRGTRHFCRKPERGRGRRGAAGGVGRTVGAPCATAVVGPRVGGTYEGPVRMSGRGPRGVDGRTSRCSLRTGRGRRTGSRSRIPNRSRRRRPGGAECAAGRRRVWTGRVRATVWGIPASVHPPQAYQPPVNPGAFARIKGA